MPVAGGQSGLAHSLSMAVLGSLHRGGFRARGHHAGHHREREIRVIMVSRKDLVGCVATVAVFAIGTAIGALLRGGIDPYVAAGFVSAAVPAYFLYFRRLRR